MKKLMNQYYEAIIRIFEKIKDNEQANIIKAAEKLANRIKNEKLVYVVGTGGHSIIIAEEMFYRAGSLQSINSMLDAGVSLTQGGVHSTFIERTSNYATSLLNYYGVGKDDVIIIVNVNGINNMTIETALESKKRGATVIGVTSVDFASSVPENTPARHCSNKNLHEIADIVLDLHVPIGDAVLEVPGIPVKIGPSSTLVAALTVNMLMVTTIEILLKWGYTPPIWLSANIPGGDEHNKKFIESHRGIIKHL
jgi:uncharacterized phosphosugar-binding protein